MIFLLIFNLNLVVKSFDKFEEKYKLNEHKS
jgi:hypothetical protein